MDNNEITKQIETLSKELEGQRKTISHVVDLLVKISSSVDDGFIKVNERLAALEGNQGMQGVHSQLSDIKTELGKIQKAYPYNEIIDNMKVIKGEA